MKNDVSSWLYLFVEGDDDERFFEHVFKAELQRKGISLSIFQYAQRPDKFGWVARFAKSIARMGAQWVFVADANDAPCVAAKKQEIVERLSNAGAKDPTVAVVVKEIESWYIAGLDQQAWRSLGLRGKAPRSTEQIGKEDFNQLIPPRFDSRLDFMIETLKHSRSGPP